ncbi:MAG: hypothetical protein JWQ27_48 [Ferruginibacter sp.]|nr:hypothetical protein [Ferruginibacter sp.]
MNISYQLFPGQKAMYRTRWSGDQTGAIFAIRRAVSV